jgi:hypothetical protein
VVGRPEAGGEWRRPVALPQGAGIRGSMRVVTEWAKRRRRSETPDARSPQCVPSARTIARLMATCRDTLSKLETITVAMVEADLLVEAQEVNTAFHDDPQEGSRRPLPMAGTSTRKPRRVLRKAASQGQGRDHDVLANRQAEGQITKLKLVKRQIYGRAKGVRASSRAPRRHRIADLAVPPRTRPRLCIR